MATIITQDPSDPFTPRIEELLRERDAARGIGRPVVVLLCDLFIYLMRLMADIAERKRAGELAATAPEAAPDQAAQAALDGGTMHGLFEQPDIKESIAEAPCEVSPCEVPGVEQPAGLPLPRRARVRKLKVLSGQAPARPQHVDHGRWPLWRGVGVFWTTEAGFLRVDSKKRGCGGGDSCVCFVTI